MNVTNSMINKNIVCHVSSVLFPKRKAHINPQATEEILDNTPSGSVFEYKPKIFSPATALGVISKGNTLPIHTLIDVTAHCGMTQPMKHSINSITIL